MVTGKDRTEEISEEDGIVQSGFDQSRSVAGEAYDPSGYILPAGQFEPNIKLPKRAELCVIRGDGFE